MGRTRHDGNDADAADDDDPSYVPKGDPFSDQLAPFQSSQSHIIDDVNMKNIGWLYEIVDVLQDRVANKWVCWPKLERWKIVIEREKSSCVDIICLNEVRSLIKKFRRGSLVLGSG